MGGQAYCSLFPPVAIDDDDVGSVEHGKAESAHKGFLFFGIQALLFSFLIVARVVVPMSGFCGKLLRRTSGRV